MITTLRRLHTSPTLFHILFLLLKLVTVSSSLSHQIPISNNTASSTPGPIRVAVIGAGPGGLFLAHSVRRRLQNKRENAPDIQLTLFEQSSSPGGVWRAAEVDVCCNNTHEAPRMYAALWTNGPSHEIEFSDYTYDDHFKRPVTVYLPRRDYLDYMLSRVQGVLDADIIETNTRVDYVVFDEEQSAFFVTTKSTQTGRISVRTFDKVVWAAGANAKSNLPREYIKILWNFTGRVIHSSAALKNLHNKRVLLIGGSHSAEDLALRSIQLGAVHAVIVTRAKGLLSLTTAWPYDKVTVVDEHMVIGAEGSTLHLREVSYDYEDLEYKVVPNSDALIVDDIDVIVFCTGYKPNFSMLDKGLIPREHLSAFYDVGQHLSIPKDWTMEQPDWLQERIGDVPIGQGTLFSLYAHPELYRGVMIANPSMMFLPAVAVDFPILEVDVSAWLLSGFLTEDVALPGPGEMRKINDKQVVAELKRPYFRYSMDSAYRKVVNENWDAEWDDWTEEYKQYESVVTHELKIIAQSMREGGYDLDIGTFEELNGNGTSLVQFAVLAVVHGRNVSRDHMENPWRTYRDCENAESFYSLRTGTKAVALRDRWLDLDAPPGFSTRLYDDTNARLSLIVSCARNLLPKEEAI